MKFTRLSDNPTCPNGQNCPAVFEREDGAIFVVGGYTPLAAGDLPVGPGEAAVVVTKELLLSALGRLQAQPPR